MLAKWTIIKMIIRMLMLVIVVWVRRVRKYRNIRKDKKIKSREEMEKDYYWKWYHKMVLPTNGKKLFNYLMCLLLLSPLKMIRKINSMDVLQKNNSKIKEFLYMILKENKKVLWNLNIKLLEFIVFKHMNYWILLKNKK